MGFNRLRERLSNITVLRIAKVSVDRAMAADIFQAAASISYYTLFAIIPFLLIVLSISTMLAESAEVQAEIVGFFLALIPKMSQKLIETNLERILELRGTVRIIGLLVFLWGATGMFTTLIVNFDRAGNLKPHRFSYIQHLKGILIMAGLALLLPVFFMAKGMIQLVLQFDLPRLQFVSEINPYLYLLLPYLIMFLVLSGLYRWGPAHTISWGSAVISSMVITLIMRATSAGFTWYLARGVSKYNVLYGSLGAVLVLLFWLFLIMSILLYGAHLGTVIERHRRNELTETFASEAGY